MIETPKSGHEPVLLEEVLNLLLPKSSHGPGHGRAVGHPQIIIDCTLGRGGHSRAMAEQLTPSDTLIALDADPRNLSYAAERLKGLPCTVRLFHANFSQIGDVLREANLKFADAILADLGISTNQLFDPSYGMSFDRSMPLDMRLDPDLPENAADLVNRLPEEQLANVLYELAQERYSRRIARKIVEARRVCPINDTEALAELVRSAIPRRGGAPERIDPATRTFLALRMAVNREMKNLQTLLSDAPGLLASHARMAVISFQSMEDRAVKQAFRSLEQTGVVNVVTNKPVVPSETEIARNPRSRSAKMRVIEKI